MEDAVNNPYITQARVDELIGTLNTTYNALALREIETKEAQTEFIVIVNELLNVKYVDYFDIKELSSVTFEYETMA